jgi:hypothetical protein
LERGLGLGSSGYKSLITKTSLVHLSAELAEFAEFAEVAEFAGRFVPEQELLVK